MPQGEKRRRWARYNPPPASLVQTTTLGALLDDIRPIPEQQQKRLGFDEGPDGPLLWIVGDRHLVRERAVAIVGTRNVSTEGAARARRLARELVANGVVIVSGLAKGVDTEALSAAIDAGGRVIGVIGTPIDEAFPAENRDLHELIYRHHLLISQFERGSTVYPTNFPARNKLMAVITDATVIIEASDTSGTLHQAKECERLGRWLFIAQSLLADDRLSWPRAFSAYKKMRPLTQTKDVLEVLAHPTM